MNFLKVVNDTVVNYLKLLDRIKYNKTKYQLTIAEKAARVKSIDKCTQAWNYFNFLRVLQEYLNSIIQQSPDSAMLCIKTYVYNLI